jgi:hypothetical protein
LHGTSVHERGVAKSAQALTGFRLGHVFTLISWHNKHVNEY